jgi:ABC-type amino acid transport substrate-binding protein
LAGSFLLLAAAMLFYVPWLAAILAGPQWVEPGTGSGEGRMAEAWADLFALLLGIPLWLALGGLVFLAWRKGFAPRAWSAAAGMLYLLAAIATYGAIKTNLTWPGGWSILVPALLPPLLALYGVGVRVPALATGSMHLAPAIALGGIALTAVAAIPFAYIDPVGYPARLAREKQGWDAAFAQRDADALDAARRWEADISKLGPDSPLAAWLDYVNGSVASEPLHQQALDGARHANSRQADTIALLDRGQIRRLSELWQLDLPVTPALCTAYDRALHRLATTDDPFEAMVGEQLERQVQNLKFLLAAHCDLAASFDAVTARADKVAEVNPGDERWVQLRATLAAMDRSR